MTPRFRRALSVLALVVLAATPVAAQVGLDELTPDEGTVGTVLDLRLTGDTGKGKPLVWLTRSDDGSNKPRRTKLKLGKPVDEGGGVTSFSAALKKITTGAGAYDLHVRPKGKGQVESVFEGAFTVRGPELTMVTPGTAAPKSEVTMTGAFFGGPAKPKVFLLPQGGGKPRKAKVRQVLDDTMLLVKLGKMAGGTYDVILANKVGETVLAGGLVVVGGGGGGPGGPNPGGTFRVDLASPGANLIVSTFQAGAPGTVLTALDESTPGNPTLIVTAGIFQLQGLSGLSMTLTMPFEPGVTPTPFSIPLSDPAVQIVVAQSNPDATWSSFQGGSGTFTIMSASANQVTGSFSVDDLSPTNGSGAPNPLQMTNGQFDVPITQL